PGRGPRPRGRRGTASGHPGRRRHTAEGGIKPAGTAPALRAGQDADRLPSRLRPAGGEFPARLRGIADPHHGPRGDRLLRPRADARRVRLTFLEAVRPELNRHRRPRGPEPRQGPVHQPRGRAAAGREVQGRPSAGHSDSGRGRAQALAVRRRSDAAGDSVQVIVIAVVCAAIGLLLGLLSPVTIPIGYARYTAVALLAALDSIFGAFKAYIAGTYEPRVFLTGLVTNM